MQALSIPAVSVAGCSACIPGICCRLPELPAQPCCRLRFYFSNNSQAFAGLILIVNAVSIYVPRLQAVKNLPIPRNPHG